MREIITVRKLMIKRSRQVVLDGVDLDVAHGEVCVLVGRNGAGKTTLFHALLGGLNPKRGLIRVFGKDPVRHQRYVREQIGFVPSIPDVPSEMTFNEIAAFMEPHFPSWSATRLDEMSAWLCVSRGVPFGTLSKGQQMKAMLALALAHDPKLLLLDEPFGGIDPIARKEILEGLIHSIQPMKRAILIATHDLDAAARVADAFLFMKDRGRIHKRMVEDIAEDVRPVTETLLAALERIQTKESTPCTL